MDGSRKRRTKDPARKSWYARHRQARFARWLGFGRVDGDLILVPVAIYKMLPRRP